MKLNKPIAQMGVEEGKGGAFISARLRNPEAEIAAARARPDVVGAVFAIIATILLLATTVLICMNWNDIRFA